MKPVYLALYWHQHQPYYPDDVANEILMPWVRLHGTKDYYGMAMHLLEVPEFQCTINLVPSLLLQIEQLLSGRRDQHLEISHRPADDLSQADVDYLLGNFFMANVDSMIRPYPRYFELYLKRGLHTDTVENARGRFNERDLRDLQVWSNLTWIHELAFEKDSELAEFRARGRNWSESDKQWLLEKQREILGQIIPLHKELAERGQVELTTTPFFHPILPLLWNKRSAHEAMPGCALPEHLESYAEDAHVQLRRAVEYHERMFGAPPEGMWPSEGSVSHDIVPAIADAGIRWIATDEEILSRSTGGWVSRDGQGHIHNPELLFRPWRVEKEGRSLEMVFRDHALSDLIGFHYQRNEPTQAAADLLQRIEATGRAIQGRNTDHPPLIPIILDGENCWEYYPDGGVAFLRTFYRSAAKHPHVRPVKIGEHLKQHPATDKIAHLHAGSWISHNFAIWIGHQEDNNAWDRLHETRVFLKERSAAGKVEPETLARAWDELYIAEGSDWFWWYGDDHSSDQDALFDSLFRRHLQNVHTLLGEAPPANLYLPISRGVSRTVHTQPTALLPVSINGRRTYFEWIDAGKYVSGNERGTMTIVTASLMPTIYFGFDERRLLLRVDTTSEAANDLMAIDRLSVRFHAPQDYEIRVEGFANGAVSAQLYFKNERTTTQNVQVAIGTILEIAVPLADLDLQPEEPVHFAVEAIANQNSLDRAPREGSINLRCPTANFERMMWKA